MNTPAPLQLNGYPVIKFEVHPKCATVMVQGEGKLVVATWWPELGSGWSWGHYFHPQGDTIGALEACRQEADSDFAETAKRNRSR